MGLPTLKKDLNKQLHFSHPHRLITGQLASWALPISHIKLYQGRLQVMMIPLPPGTVAVHAGCGGAMTSSMWGPCVWTFYLGVPQGSLGLMMRLADRKKRPP